MNWLPAYVAYFNRMKRRQCCQERVRRRGNVVSELCVWTSGCEGLSSPVLSSWNQRPDPGTWGQTLALMNGRWKVRWWNMFVWTMDIRTIDSAKCDICAAGVTLRHCPHCDILTADVWNKTSVVTTLNYRKIQSLIMTVYNTAAAT